jgi:hypothetical protein
LDILKGQVIKLISHLTWEDIDHTTKLDEDPDDNTELYVSEDPAYLLRTQATSFQGTGTESRRSFQGFELDPTLRGWHRVVEIRNAECDLGLYSSETPREPEPPEPFPEAGF